MEMQEHTIVGEKILSPREFFAISRQIARSHHENWDGSGYPDHLDGQRIPTAARIVHVVDVYDALTSKPHLQRGLGEPAQRRFSRRAGGQNV